ncbi:MAG TPA: response regulator transcription factor [Bacillota bacterium]|nr:response regulator transcription factor [Bacillota bacterium]
MKLLIVEDERRLAEALSHLLKRNGFVVDTADDGETGIEMACMGIYDLIILDRILPGRDGLSILKEFRSLGFDTPVLFLTAKDSPEDRADGLNAGADDYLIKPFYTVELLARLQALSRRKNKDLSKNLLMAGDILFDPSRGHVIKGNETIQLTLKESQLFELLMRNFGKVVTKETIIQKVWSFDKDAEFTTVNLYVHYLRKKLQIDNLVTVRESDIT